MYLKKTTNESGLPEQKMTKETIFSEAREKSAGNSPQFSVLSPQSAVHSTQASVTQNLYFCLMTDLQEKTHETFTNSFPKGEPVYWWYDYEDAVFRSLLEEGERVRYFVKYAWNNGVEFEMFTKDSNVLMDSISDLDKVLITKEDYDKFPQETKFKK